MAESKAEVAVDVSQPRLPDLPRDPRQRPRRHLRRVAGRGLPLRAGAERRARPPRRRCTTGRARITRSRRSSRAWRARSGRRSRSTRARRGCRRSRARCRVARMSTASPRVALVDYGAGNLRSVAKALERSGLAVEVTSDAAAVARADAVVLPGVGAFAAAAENLRAKGIDRGRARRHRRRPALPRALPRPPAPVRRQRRARSRRRASAGSPATCAASPSRPRDRPLRVPHIGWNEVRWQGAHPMLETLPESDVYYFVHGWRALPESARRSHRELRLRRRRSRRPSRTRTYSPCSSTPRRARRPASACSTPSRRGCARAEARALARARPPSRAPRPSPASARWWTASFPRARRAPRADRARRGGAAERGDEAGVAAGAGGVAPPRRGARAARRRGRDARRRGRARSARGPGGGVPALAARLKSELRRATPCCSARSRAGSSAKAARPARCSPAAVGLRRRALQRAGGRAPLGGRVRPHPAGPAARTCC